MLVHCSVLILWYYCEVFSVFPICCSPMMIAYSPSCLPIFPLLSLIYEMYYIEFIRFSLKCFTWPNIEVNLISIYVQFIRMVKGREKLLAHISVREICSVNAHALQTSSVYRIHTIRRYAYVRTRARERIVYCVENGWQCCQ